MHKTVSPTWLLFLLSFWHFSHQFTGAGSISYFNLKINVIISSFGLIHTVFIGENTLRLIHTVFIGENTLKDFLSYHSRKISSKFRKQ